MFFFFGLSKAELGKCVHEREVSNRVSIPTYDKSLYDMINLSNEELLKIILYGHEQLPFDSNAKILIATLEYIQASKRFE